MDPLPNDLVTIQFIERGEMALNEWARKLDSNIFPVYIKYNKSELPLSCHHEVHGCSSNKDPTVPVVVVNNHTQPTPYTRTFHAMGLLKYGILNEETSRGFNQPTQLGFANAYPHFERP